MNPFNFYWWLRTVANKLKNSRYKAESEQANNQRNQTAQERINVKNQTRNN